MRKIKQLLAVSFSLVFVAFNASAAMTNTLSGDSSLILTVNGGSATSGNSATFDLGFNYSTFSSELFALSNASPGGQYYTWDLANNSNYADNWALFGTANDSTNVNWGVFAGDRLGAGAGEIGLVSSHAAGSVFNPLLTTSLRNVLTNADLYYDANNVLGSHPNKDNGSSISSIQDESKSSWIYNENKTLKGTSIIGLSGLDTSMSLVSLTSGRSGFAPATVSQPLNPFGFNPTYTLSSNGILTYWNGRLSPIEPVPEADTWSMMLLGLGAISTFSRLRKSKLKTS